MTHRAYLCIALLAACDRTGSHHHPHGQAPGMTGISAALTATASDDFAAVTLAVDPPGDEVTLTLPEAGDPVVTLEHTFTLAPGLTTLSATPKTRDGAPSVWCRPATSEVTVREGHLEVVALTILCDTPTGGVDVVVNIGTQPYFTAVAFDPPVVPLTCEPVSIEFTAIDPDGDPLTFVWEVHSGAGLYRLDPAGARADFVSEDPGTYTLFVTATDGDGQSATVQFPVPVGLGLARSCLSGGSNWTCPETYFGTDDGCDCGCGMQDTDCEDLAAATCVYNNCPPGEVPVDGENYHCTGNICGDGFISFPVESCEPPGTLGCDADCQLIADICGNAVVEVGEDCEPPNTTGCDDECHYLPPCVGDDCPLPDLTVDQSLLGATVSFGQESFEQNSCVMQEECVAHSGDVDLLYFSTSTPNLGEGDFFLGDPTEVPGAEWSECHGHYHYHHYASYRLLGPGQTVAATGHKQAFCLLDVQKVDPSAGPAKYNCSYQGITAGWADIYSSGIECQWIDITGVPAGEYTLEVTVNPDHVIEESDYDNNTALVPVTIP